MAAPVSAMESAPLASPLGYPMGGGRAVAKPLCEEPVLGLRQDAAEVREHAYGHRYRFPSWQGNSTVALGATVDAQFHVLSPVRLPERDVDVFRLITADPTKIRLHSLHS